MYLAHLGEGLPSLWSSWGRAHRANRMPNISGTEMFNPGTPKCVTPLAACLVLHVNHFSSLPSPDHLTLLLSDLNTSPGALAAPPHLVSCSNDYFCLLAILQFLKSPLVLTAHCNCVTRTSRQLNSILINVLTSDNEWGEPAPITAHYFPIIFALVLCKLAEELCTPLF